MSKKGRKQSLKTASSQFALDKSPEKQPPKVAREAVFQPEFLEDLEFWVETDPKAASKIMKLVKSCLREPFQGIGKPEGLKFLGPNIWSRRITQEHRMTYEVGNTRIDFLSARFHYD